MSTAEATQSALAFDVGERWVGIAIGNALTHSARPLLTLQREHADFWERLAQLIQEWRPQALVIGDPLTLDGEEQEATRVARRFARRLHGRFGLPIALIDERGSSKEADRRFAAQRRAGLKRRRDGDQQDATAAAIILERWLDAGMPLLELNHESHERDTPPSADP